MHFRRAILILMAVVVPFSFFANVAVAQEDVNEKIIKYYRKKADIPPSTPVTVKDSKASPISGAKQGTLQIGTPPRVQTSSFTASADGRYVIFGEVDDITVDPSKAIMSKIDLKDEPFRGPADAKVTIVEYSDFQCPFCAKGYKTLEEEVLPAYQGKIKFYYKHLPLPFHNWAEPASIAQECIKQQDPEAGWKVYDKMFQDQKALTAENVKAKALEYAGGSKIDTAKFDACFDKKETLAKIREDKAEATALGISGTPTFVVNGRLVKGAQPADKFKAVIDDELASSK